MSVGRSAREGARRSARAVGAAAGCAAALVAAAVGAQAPGRVRCEVTDNGAAAEGDLVARQEGRVAASAPCDGPVRLAPGRYEVEVRLAGALDRPTVSRVVTVEAGRLEVVQAAFHTGSLRVEVVQGGRAAAAMVEVRKDGAPVGRVSAGVPARVGVGTYEVRIRHLHGERTEVARVSEGKETVVRLTLD